MRGEDTELCGFLDAKLPGSRCMTRVKKRSLSLWKVWRRHWCSVRKLGPGLGVEILLDCGVSNVGPVIPNEKDNCIKIPSDAIICRAESRSKQFAFGIFPAKERKPLLYLCTNSETESQRWMAGLRQLLRPRRHRFMEGTFNISMVDNAHSRAAGLTGLHGDLVASRSGVFVKDTYSGDIVENFEWKEMNQFHLTTSGHPEDVKRVCVIHTTKDFRGGVGELHIFSLDAKRLLQNLVTQGRGPKNKHFNPRPLSLSEGDLRLSIYKDEENGSYPILRSRVATNIINAGLGLILSSRSGSEAKLIEDISKNTMLEKMSRSKMTMHTRAIDNVYQPEPANSNVIMSSLEELEEPSSRRVSNISVASGIYEEIIEDPLPPKTVRLYSNLYEDPEELLFNFCGPKLQPPPLPPRQRYDSNSTKNGSISDDGLDSEGGTRSATPNTQEDSTPTFEEKTAHRVLVDTSDYVPMSPRLKDITLHNELQLQQSEQDGIYMVMR